MPYSLVTTRTTTVSGFLREGTVPNHIIAMTRFNARGVKTQRELYPSH